MWIYWVLFALPALIALHYLHVNTLPSRGALLGFTIFITIIVGLRYDVGVDWGNYIAHYELAMDASLYDAVTTTDSAFGLLNWFASLIGLNVWLVNLVCAGILAAGLLQLARRTPHPWVALTISIPQIVIVVGMGYTRQSAAIGCICLALVAMDERRLVRFLVFVFAAALFHRTAIIMLFLGLLGTDMRRLGVGKAVKSILRWLLVVAMGGIGYLLFLSETRENLAETYISSRMISDGTYPRVMMNITAAVAYLLLIRPRQPPGSFFRTFWTSYARTAIPFVVAIIMLPPLTAIDRLALYWMPLQIYACGHLPAAVTGSGLKGVAGVGILVTYGVTQYVWFTYANYSWAWKPYHFYPIDVWMRGMPL